MKNKEAIRTLFLTFFKIGAFTFGGGYAMIPIIEHEIVKTHKWMDEKDIADIITIAESTPGPIAINSATFVGYRVAGVLGSVAATTGVVLPSLVIIVALSILLQKFRYIPLIDDAFWGIRIAVIALIINAFLKMYKQCPKNILSYALAVIGFVAVMFFNVNALIIILLAAISGITYYSIKTAKQKEDSK